MTTYEYTTRPAPVLASTADRIHFLNQMGKDGWLFLRVADWPNDDLNDTGEKWLFIRQIKFTGLS